MPMMPTNVSQYLPPVEWRRSGYYGKPKCTVCGKHSPTIEHLHQCAEEKATMDRTKEMGRVRTDEEIRTARCSTRLNQRCPECGGTSAVRCKVRQQADKLIWRYFDCTDECRVRFKISETGTIALVERISEAKTVGKRAATAGEAAQTREASA